MESVLEKLISPDVIWAVIPTVAIIAFVGKKMLDRYLSHKERMAKIEAGIDPDATGA